MPRWVTDSQIESNRSYASTYDMGIDFDDGTLLLRDAPNDAPIGGM